MLIKVFLLAILAVAVRSQCVSENDVSGVFNKDAKANLYMGQQAFTVALLNATNRATPNENVFFSPYSTYHALLLAYFGARNQTETGLKKVLNLEWADSKFDVMQAYRIETQQRARRSQNSSVDFTSADRLFFAPKVEVKDCMKDIFHDEIETLDYEKDPELARLTINKWVENVTKENIKEILVPGSLSAQTTVVLANAAYFKGSWASKFEADKTQKEIFYSSSEKQTFVDMMNKKGYFNHALNEHLGAHVLEIPYEGDGTEISCVILLPPFTPNGLDDVLSKLTPESLQRALDDGTSREVELKLPKFSFEKKYELVPILEQMQVGDLFQSTSNLAGFSDSHKIQLDDAVHQAKIDVDEEGSTAAAATVLFSFRSSRPLDPLQFYCNHPFLFLIYDHRSRAVLFAGIYRGPDN
ncbi:serine protease inhibitor 88Ea-like [Phlebotomus argentipes]|uniref:serine protease inhibitor 88Ea-like n=1 Tax=Phlebotomus argentipes TaxID=94469 RepID=UPI002892A796|nr:serine protease inhibitor 88Ea-like [Phlebotomus argentipes]